jgi:predicted aminopeptidase
VKAYSTLGWFADPLLNTFIHYPESDLAALIFHELAHQVVYVQDDSAFNEAFATAVELALVEEWLKNHGDPALAPGLLAQRERQAAITAMVLEYRDRLALAYQGPDRAARKEEIFAAMKQEYENIRLAGGGTPYYDYWFQRPLNNADLLSVATYFHLVPAFSEMLRRMDGDLPAFFEEVRKLGEKPAETRQRLLEELIPG